MLGIGLMPIEVLALDLEGTLISNAMSQFPRKGLYSFLEFRRQAVPRVVVYTTVREPRFRTIAQTLAAEGAVPLWFPGLEYIAWQGSFKDLSLVPSSSPELILLLDDQERYILPEQKQQWLPVPEFTAPYQDDEVLAALIPILEARLDS